jgi:hypothetical protein
MREKALRDNEEPRFMHSNTDIDDPKRTQPSTDSEDAKRDKRLNDRELPKIPNSMTANAAPSRA